MITVTVIMIPRMMDTHTVTTRVASSDWVSSQDEKISCSFQQITIPTTLPQQLQYFERGREPFDSRFFSRSLITSGVHAALNIY